MLTSHVLPPPFTSPSLLNHLQHTSYYDQSSSIVITTIYLQHRWTYGKNRTNRISYRISVDMGSNSPTEFQCCMAVWCQWSILVSGAHILCISYICAHHMYNYVCAYLMLLISLIINYIYSPIHHIIFPPSSKHSGMHLELQSKCYYLVSSPLVLRILLPPHTPCVRLFVLVGVNQHISPSSSSHSVPTSSLLQCFCWVVLPPSRHLLE